MSTGAIHGMSILVWSAGLHAPERVATLFLMAQACAAMDLETELHFTAASIELLRKSNRSVALGYGPAPQSLQDYLAETAAAGVRMLACSQALHAQGLDRSELVDSCAGLGGVVQFAARCADPAWRTLVF